MGSSLSASVPGLPQIAPRAAAYVRVSTARQAEHETSLADQVAAITSYCEARGIFLADVYREPGASRETPVELRQLKQLLVLSETLNFHRAAERLHMAQPPLSTAIKKLEQDERRHDDP